MLVIIDGNNWFGRAWFSLKPTKATEPEIVKADLEERSTRAIQTTGHWIQDTKRQLHPETLAICWDSPSSFRKELFPAYKGGREEKPEGYYEAMEVLRRRLREYWNVEMDGYEADDLMAKFAIDAVKTNDKCLLCSSDKDLHQCLVAGSVSQCTEVKRREGSQKLDFHVLNAEGFEGSYKMPLSQWLDYRCMAGDKSDNLPKPYGIGDKIARQILSACGTLDAFYDDPSKAGLSATRLNAMLEFKEHLPLLRKLITLPLRHEEPA